MNIVSDTLFVVAGCYYEHDYWQEYDSSDSNQLFFNRFKISAKIRQLFPYCLPDFLCGRFAATYKRQIIFIRSFSVGARFVFSGSMKPVNQLLGTFPRLIQKVCVLRIFDLRRRTGRVNYHGSAVAVIIAVIVIGMIFRLVPG